MPQTQGAGTVMTGGPGTALRGPLYIKSGQGSSGQYTLTQLCDSNGKLAATFRQRFVLQGTAGATAGNYGVAGILPACKLISVKERHGTAGNDGSAVTIMVKKVPSGTAVGSGTDCLSAGISLKATADTNQAGALHATAANYTFADGDAWGVALTGTPTSVAGVVVEAEFQLILSNP